MLVNSQVRSLNHYELLGISPTSDPDVIDSAFYSLTRKYRDAGGGEDRMQQVDAAYQELKDPQRRRKYDATIGAATTTGAGAAMWRIKDQPNSRDTALSETADGVVASLATMAAVSGSASRIRAQPSALPAGVSPSHDSALSGSDRPIGNSAVQRIRGGPSVSTGDSSRSASEPPLPTDDPTEDATPRRAFGWARIGVPLVAVFAVTAAALTTQSLFDMPTALVGSEEQRGGPATAGANQIGSPQQQAARQSTDRSVDQPLQSQGADSLSMLADETGGLRDAAADNPQIAPVPASSDAAQVNPAPRAGSVAAQAAAPAPAIPVAEKATVAEAQPEPPNVTVEPAKVIPARWISGGLLDTDNPGGRYEGVVGVRIAVRADGRVGGCRVAQSSGSSSLDDVTCRLVEPRLQFSPARDALGRAIESEIRTTYTWGRRRRR